MNTIQGWVYWPYTQRWHYIAYGHSLCGSVAYCGNFSPNPVSGAKCGNCSKLLAIVEKQRQVMMMIEAREKEG